MAITHVFGQGAADYITSHNLTGARVALSLNPKDGANGQTPETKRHILITPGTYQGDYYLGRRAYVTVEGAPEARPILVNDEIGVGLNLDFTLKHLELRNCIVSWTQRDDGPCNALFDGVEQHSQLLTRNANGFINSNLALKFPQTVTFKNCKLDGGGSAGNTKHQMYIERRGDVTAGNGSTLIIEDSELSGANACSIIKSTCNVVEIRRNKINTRSQRDPRRTAGSLLDLVACSTRVVTDNEFVLWRNPDAQAPSPSKGLMVPALHWRSRRPMLGSDIPAYPNIAWEPPVSTYVDTASSPGGGWDKGPATYIDSKFWDWVAANYDNPEALFCAYVSGNRFIVPEDSRGVPWLRDDGTRPVQAAGQFETKTIMLRAPENFVERAVTYYAPFVEASAVGSLDPGTLNTYQGAVGLEPVLDSEYGVVEVEPGAIYPRTEPQHYSRAIEVAPLSPQLPAWFLQ